MSPPAKGRPSFKPAPLYPPPRLMSAIFSGQLINSYHDDGVNHLVFWLWHSIVADVWPDGVPEYRFFDKEDREKARAMYVALGRIGDSVEDLFQTCLPQEAKEPVTNDAAEEQVKRRRGHLGLITGGAGTTLGALLVGTIKPHRLVDRQRYRVPKRLSPEAGTSAASASAPGEALSQ